MPISRFHPSTPCPPAQAMAGPRRVRVGPCFPPHSTSLCGDVLHRPNTTSLSGVSPCKMSPKGGINPRKAQGKESAPQGQCHPTVGVATRRVPLSGTCSPRRVPPLSKCTPKRVQPPSLVDIALFLGGFNPGKVHCKQGESQGECHPQAAAPCRQASLQGGCHQLTDAPSDWCHPKPGTPQQGCT